MSRARRLVGAAVVLPALTVPVGTSVHAASRAVPAPPSKWLPKALDGQPTYVGQTTCQPDPKPGVVAFARLMAAHYDEWNYGISRNCNSGVTEHSEGRALDWMLSAYDPYERAVADSVVQWLTAPDREGHKGAMARRFGVMYIIWNQKMWRAYDPDRGWAPYVGDSPHTDHIHFSFSWDGALKKTSWWTGRPVNPDGSSSTGPVVPQLREYPVLRKGDTGKDVALVQKALGLPADGAFGQRTFWHVANFHQKQGLPVTGVVDKAMWQRLVDLNKVAPRGTMTKSAYAYRKTWIKMGSQGNAVKALQAKLGGLTADGRFGPMTKAKVIEFQRSKRTTANGVVGPRTWALLLGLPAPQAPKPTPAPRPVAPKPHPVAPKPGTSTVETTTAYTRYKGTTVKRGSRGEAVRLVQRGVGVPVDGVFGPRTELALERWQKAHDLRADGVVQRADWDALEAQAHPLLKWRSTVLKEGSRGWPVKAVQRNLGVTSDGYFGARTMLAVKALQQRHGLAGTGVVASRTWRALEVEVVARANR